MFEKKTLRFSLHNLTCFEWPGWIYKVFYFFCENTRILLKKDWISIKNYSMIQTFFNVIMETKPKAKYRKNQVWTPSFWTCPSLSCSKLLTTQTSRGILEHLKNLAISRISFIFYFYRISSIFYWLIFSTYWLTWKFFYLKRKTSIRNFINLLLII